MAKRKLNKLCRTCAVNLPSISNNLCALCNKKNNETGKRSYWKEAKKRCSMCLFFDGESFYCACAVLTEKGLHKRVNGKIYIRHDSSCDKYILHPLFERDKISFRSFRKQTSST